MKLKKGQAALEYLMTYGWTILVITIVALVLYYMDIFNTTPIPGSRGFSQITPVPGGWKASGNTFSVILTNEAGSKLSVSSIDATIGSIDCTAETPSVELRPGETYRADITCTGLSDYSIGEYYKADVVIVYQNLGSGMDHTITGSCWGPVE